MIEVGILLAKHIVAYNEKKISSYEKGHLTRIIQNRQGHIGRILHYYPFEEKGIT